MSGRGGRGIAPLGAQPHRLVGAEDVEHERDEAEVARGAEGVLRPVWRARSRRRGRPPRGVVYGSYQVVVVGVRPAHGRAATALMAITPTSRSLASSSRASASRRYEAIGPQLRVDREHHRVEVVATQGLELGAGGPEPVPGDPREAAATVVAGLEDRLDRSAARVELIDVGHRVQLVEIELVAAEQRGATRRAGHARRRGS